MPAVITFYKSAGTQINRDCVCVCVCVQNQHVFRVQQFHVMETFHIELYQAKLYLMISNMNVTKDTSYS
jgi:hypothetical protein